jgi:3-hydroxybutyryl-CoA dehydrogenase
VDNSIKKVGIIGAGTMGTQIAVHARCFGYQVAIFDLDGGRLVNSLQDVQWGRAGTREPVISREKWEAAAQDIRTSPNMEAALKDADLVIEAVTEKVELKRELFRLMDRLTSDRTILATASSSIPVSRLLPSTKKDSQCLNLHFYPPTAVTNMVDVMGHSFTRPGVMDAGRNWVISLHCVPLKVKKELLGFCYNRIWRAVKREALFMWANDFVDHREMDRAWMIANGTSMGPFGLMDAVGLDVVYDIEMMYHRESRKQEDLPPGRLKEKILRGELGVKTRCGFYNYPDPEYGNPDFCRPIPKEEST